LRRDLSSPAGAYAINNDEEREGRPRKNPVRPSTAGWPRGAGGRAAQSIDPLNVTA
jgi:hypothetical protein